ncbi:hypothetical protein IQ13_1373 [Lacibacter cauensis]|uniref:Uncharacterized protein n=1 Tax=Lacibacter cauensis TaxID=510947 RepID=A0A562SPQ9_9BACT|nr:hypothetical protein [Lacibacter cauensis]TWI83265.1 hypothetical protein IQ13_1373 [Lacibacter cauensis]
MSKKRPSYFAYLWKSTKWIILNAVFATAPLWILCVLYFASEKKIGGDEIDLLIYDGAIFFVSISLVGAVLVDYILSGFRPMGVARFVIYLFPLVVLFAAGTNFLLIKFNIISNSRFLLTSSTTLWTVSLSILYILFVKTDLYIKEDLNNDPRL